MKRPNKKTIKVLCELLEHCAGNRGRRDINPYTVPEVVAALSHLAELQGIKSYLDANTKNPFCS